MEPVYIGIDLGGTSAQGAAGQGGKILRQNAIPTQVALGPEAVLKELAELARTLAAGDPIAALGLGAPGLLNPEQGICINSANLGWRNVPVAAILTELLQAPVLIENDAKVAALGELSQGSARGCKDFIFMTVGTGIGGGIFTSGALLQGARWSAGEVGHMVMDPLGPDCACGSRGCLEALAAAPAIAREGRVAATANPKSLLNDVPPELIDAASVFKAAADGDKAAAAVVDRAMSWLGIAIANLVNVFNPELVVIGGGVSLAGEQLLRPIRAMIDRHCLPVQKETVAIVTSTLGDSAGVAGALELARQHWK